MFCLRCFTDDGRGDYRNVRVADFSREKDTVWRLNYNVPPLPVGFKQVLYQIYPGEPQQTFYSLKDKTLFAFVDQKCVGQTSCADQYLYFEMAPGTRNVALVIEEDVACATFAQSQNAE